MATPLYAAGGRRSAAPSVPLMPAQGTGVINLAQILEAARPQPAPAQSAPAQSTKPTSTQSSGSGRMTAATPTGAPASESPDSMNARQLASIMQGFGMLAGDKDLASLGSVIGTGAAVAGAQSPVQAGMALAPAVASKLGLPGYALGLGAGAIKNDAGMMTDAALAGINPVAGVLNSLAKSIFGVSIGTGVNNAVQDTTLGRTVLGEDAGMLDSYNEGNTINTDADPIGALIGALQAGETAQPSLRTSGGNFGGFGGVGGFAGNTGDGSGFGGGFGRGTSVA